MTPVIAALPLVAVAGFLLGGLVEVTALRLPTSEPLLSPPTCPACGSRRGWSSWLVPRRCSICQWSPRSQLVIQILSASTLVLVWLRYFPSAPLDIFRVSFFALLLLLIARIDWVHHLIYLVTVLPSLGLALLLALLASPRSFLFAAIGMLTAGVLFSAFYALGRLLYRRPALGSGDIVLAALIGAMTGALHLLPALLVGMTLAAVAALWSLVRRHAGRTTYLPYGSYLALGTIVSLLLWGPA